MEGLNTKDIRMDLCVTIDDNRKINIEMQMASSRQELRNRAAYYAASLLVSQENRGKVYRDLTEVNQISLIDFELGTDDHYEHEYVYYDKDAQDILTEVVKIHIIEIGKASQSHPLQEMNELEKWCTFLKQYGSDEVKLMSEKENTFKEANKIMERISVDQRLKDIAFERNRRKMDEAQMKLEVEDRGELRAKLELIEKMRNKGLSDDEIHDLTGLDCTQLMK